MASKSPEPPLPGYRRYEQQGRPVGVLLPSPAAWHKWYSGNSNIATYLRATRDIDGRVGVILRQLSERVKQSSGDKIEMSAVLVPLVDFAIFEKWLEDNGADGTSTQDRAAYSAWKVAQVMQESGQDNILRGFAPYSRQGDLLLSAISLAAGWDGASPRPFNPYMEKISQAVTGTNFMVRAQVVTTIQDATIRFSCSIRAAGDNLLIRGDTSDLAVLALLHLSSLIMQGNGYVSASLRTQTIKFTRYFPGPPSEMPSAEWTMLLDNSPLNQLGGTQVELLDE